MLFSFIIGEDMSIIDDVKKVLKKKKSFELIFNGKAKETTIGEIDQLHELGCSIIRKNDDLVVKK